MRKHIVTEPYDFFSWRRLDPFFKLRKPDTSFNSCLQFLMHTDKPNHTKPVDPKQKKKRSYSNHDRLQYDPISGRMAPMPPVASELKNTQSGSSHQVGDCLPSHEIKENIVSNAELLKDEQSQPRNAKSQTEAPPNSHLIVECPQGSDLEAKFISDPASRLVETLQSGLEHQDSYGSVCTTDRPPENEMNAKFSSKITNPNHQTSNTSHQETTSFTQSDSHASLECSPGVEIEAQVSPELASQDSSGPKAQVTVDCTPESELDAKSMSNPGVNIDEKLDSATPVELNSSNQADPSIEYAPGSKVEANIIPDTAKAEGYLVTEDLGTLQASDISAQCSSEAKTQSASSLDFEASKERESNLIFQKEELATEDERPTSSGHSSVEFHILAYDASKSRIITTEASSFFGINESAQLSEILSRLHHPAKFLPHFEKMQQDGYEIATGGGNILVFRKIHNASSLDTSNSTCQAKPKDPQSLSNSRAESFKPLLESSHEGDSTTNPKSFFRKAGRRMLVGGTITAATCYAIGVVTEFFRTGGKDGRGIDGFTTFESDRRLYD
ncbi:uncharacterized protein N7511_009725 [Penicillium nucicola]|uniref:uncharacterized protein n=1 Tax=Penicillium nucicola TaxID=1850975 RepID=UPI002545519A|nr:uncharacterized protein N7511_009725 [Penicillium nucicola]KAJ5748029.1 hypothetical protein N7511_009725 [Penicillium nucicola]